MVAKVGRCGELVIIADRASEQVLMPKYFLKLYKIMWVSILVCRRPDEILDYALTLKTF